MQKYWMVHRVGGGKPEKEHRFESDAREEAQRLAQANPGVSFVVLEAKEFCVCKIAPFGWQDAE